MSNHAWILLGLFLLVLLLTVKNTDKNDLG